MSLKLFHFVFILCSIGLSVFLSLWCFEGYSDSDTTGMLLLGIASAASGLGLTFYLAWFVKKLRNVSFFVLAALFLSSPSFACSVCLGDPNSPMVKSANSAVVFMLVIVGAVLSAFAGLFLLWAKRSRQTHLHSSLS